jgi:hypothetical protein
MKATIPCKVCRREITLDIDDTYGQYGDPHNIVPLATCNRCADLRDRRNRIYDAIYRACLDLLQRPNEDQRGKIAVRLTTATHRYARLLNEYHPGQVIVWTEAWPERLMEHPKQWRQILRDLRYAPIARAEALEPARVPYGDA